MKWIAIGVVLILVMLLGFKSYYDFVINPGVAEELRSNPNGERAGKVMLLTFTSGRTIPVNYLQEHGRIFVGADGPWWREFRGDGASVTLLIRGKEIEGNAVVILDKPGYTADVFSRLRPTVPKWLPDWLNGTLVEITPVH